MIYNLTQEVKNNGKKHHIDTVTSVTLPPHVCKDKYFSPDKVSIFSRFLDTVKVLLDVLEETTIGISTINS